MCSTLVSLVLISIIGNCISASSSHNSFDDFVVCTFEMVLAPASLETIEICFVGFVELITVRTPQKYVNVTTGESVFLQCMFVTTDQTTSLTIQWDFVSTSSMMPQQVDRHTHNVIMSCNDVKLVLNVYVFMRTHESGERREEASCAQGILQLVKAVMSSLNKDKISADLQQNLSCCHHYLTLLRSSTPVRLTLAGIQ